MSRLQQLLNQWSNLSDAADELQAAAAAVERAHADHPELSQSLHNIETASSEMLALIDTRISETLPANPREAAILAAFAWRAHNENDLILGPGGQKTGARAFDVSLSMALTNLMTYLIDASDADLSDVLDMWCIPSEDVEPAREQRPASVQHCRSAL
jgi:ABC-type transporter Mla subunit MlaD